MASTDSKGKIKELFVKAGGDEEGGIQYKTGSDSKFSNFMTELIGFFKLPKPKNGEAVWALLFKRHAQEAEDKGKPRKLSLEEAHKLVQTLARIILKAFMLQQLKEALTGFAKDIIASPLWKAELENLQSRGVTSFDDIVKKKEEILADAAWKSIFDAADVGRSGKLSWETNQFHVFVRGVLLYAKFPEPAGGDEVMKKMFDTFAVEGSDIITEGDCKLMVGCVMDALAHAFDAAQ